MDEAKLIKIMRKNLKRTRSELEAEAIDSADISFWLSSQANQLLLEEEWKNYTAYSIATRIEYTMEASCHLVEETDKTDEDKAAEIIDEEECKYLIKLKKRNGRILKILI